MTTLQPDVQLRLERRLQQRVRQHVGDEGADELVAHDPVLLVEAGLAAPGQPGDFLQFSIVHIMVETSQLSVK